MPITWKNVSGPGGPDVARLMSNAQWGVQNAGDRFVEALESHGARQQAQRDSLLAQNLDAHRRHLHSFTDADALAAARDSGALLESLSGFGGMINESKALDAVDDHYQLLRGNERALAKEDRLATEHTSVLANRDALTQASIGQESRAEAKHPWEIQETQARIRGQNLNNDTAQMEVDQLNRIRELDILKSDFLNDELANREEMEDLRRQAAAEAGLLIGNTVNTQGATREQLDTFEANLESLGYQQPPSQRELKESFTRSLRDIRDSQGRPMFGNSEISAMKSQMGAYLEQRDSLSADEQQALDAAVSQQQIKYQTLRDEELERYNRENADSPFNEANQVHDWHEAMADIMTEEDIETVNRVWSRGQRNTNKSLAEALGNIQSINVQVDGETVAIPVTPGMVRLALFAAVERRTKPGTDLETILRNYVEQPHVLQQYRQQNGAHQEHLDRMAMYGAAEARDTFQASARVLGHFGRSLHTPQQSQAQVDQQRENIRRQEQNERNERRQFLESVLQEQVQSRDRVDAELASVQRNIRIIEERGLHNQEPRVEGQTSRQESLDLGSRMRRMQQESGEGRRLERQQSGDRIRLERHREEEARLKRERDEFVSTMDQIREELDELK